LIPDYVPAPFRQPSDAAKRCADIVTLASVAGSAGCYVAIRLSDGGSDRVPYPSRPEAISHQLHPERCMYVLVPPDGMPAHEAEAVLDYWRRLADAGVRDDNPDLLLPRMPLTRRDRARQIKVLKKGRR